MQHLATVTVDMQEKMENMKKLMHSLLDNQQVVIIVTCLILACMQAYSYCFIVISDFSLFIVIKFSSKVDNFNYCFLAIPCTE